MGRYCQRKGRQVVWGCAGREGEREEMGPSVFFNKCSLIDDSVQEDVENLARNQLSSPKKTNSFYNSGYLLAGMCLFCPQLCGVAKPVSLIQSIATRRFSQIWLQTRFESRNVLRTLLCSGYLLEPFVEILHIRAFFFPQKSLVCVPLSDDCHQQNDLHFSVEYLKICGKALSAPSFMEAHIPPYNMVGQHPSAFCLLPL